jgi:hypothetical protein
VKVKIARILQTLPQLDSWRYTKESTGRKLPFYFNTWWFHQLCLGSHHEDFSNFEPPVSTLPLRTVCAQTNKCQLYLPAKEDNITSDKCENFINWKLINTFVSAFINHGRPNLNPVVSIYTRRSSSWGPDSRSADNKFLTFKEQEDLLPWWPQLPLNPISSPFNPVHTLALFFLKIHFNIHIYAYEKCSEYELQPT